MKFLLILLFAAPAFAQPTVTYDKFRDVTSVSGESARVSSLHMVPTCLHKGEKLTAAADLHCYLIFRSASRSWEFLKSRDLIFLVDGERVDLGKGTHEGDVSSSRYRVGVTERMMFKIPRAELEKITAASSVEFKLGYVEGKLDPKDLKGIKDVLAYK